MLSSIKYEDMTFFQWGEIYESGNEIIDNDHKVLLRLINDLYLEMARGDGKEIVNSTLDQLVDYSKNHFRREEMLMKSIDYPYFEEHETQHDAFIAMISKFLKRTNSDSITLDMANFLKNWLSNHILVSDKKFAYHLELKNITKQLPDK